MSININVNNKIYEKCVTYCCNEVLFILVDI